MDQVDIAVAFTETFKRYEHDHPAIREAMCLKTQYPAILGKIRDGDLFAGRVTWPAVGFRFFSNPGFTGYYCREEKIQDELDKKELSPSDREKWIILRNFWAKRTTTSRIKARVPPDSNNGVKYNDGNDDSLTPVVAVYNYRVSGINLDFNKLLRRGIAGMLKEVNDGRAAAAEKTGDPKICEGMRICLEVLSDACRFYAVQAKEMADQTLDSRRKAELDTMRQALEAIAQEPPKTFHEAIQLFWLYARLANADNFGRLDIYLADFFDRDLESHRIDEKQALYMLQALWRLIADEIPGYSGRIFIGGRGRPNEAAADRLALLAMEASRTVRQLIPQLSLRLYAGMNPVLFSKALDVIGEGGVFPMLYNDDVNIPAFQNIFKVNRLEAEQYLASDCGEFGLDHSSLGLPDGSFNMAKILELTLHNGIDPVSGRPMGLQTGTCAEFTTFETLWNAYAGQTEYFIGALIDRFKPVYPVLEEDTCALFIAMLTDDCLKKGQGLFTGVRYKGLLFEIYGTISVADSLSAIKEVVFDREWISLARLVKILDANFSGYEKERCMMRNAPKFGNDNVVADDMAIKVYRHICTTVQACRERMLLDFCLPDLINAGGHITFGKQVGALPDGRKAGMPLSNANNPSNGNDRTGVTALLNSLVKLHPSEIGGQVQYLKLDRALFTKSRAKLEALLKAYFNNGGSQVMITVVCRDDLENAMKEPEKYGDLIVRIGGFCAKFVSLSRDFQEEIIARTLQG